MSVRITEVDLKVRTEFRDIQKTIDFLKRQGWVEESSKGTGDSFSMRLVHPHSPGSYRVVEQQP